VAGQPHGAAAAEIVVGAGKGVDAVVMCAVGEGAELVEEVVAVATADEPEQAVLGGGGDWAGANILCSGNAFAADAVAAQNVALVAIA
jgi:hypothetical protein